MEKTILITGGAGFIGSNFVRMVLATGATVVNLDKLTYAGNPENLKDIKNNEQYTFVQGDVADAALVDKLFTEHKFTHVVHFAAESHVDRSIEDSFVFTTTNVLGTHVLLEAARKFGVTRFIQIGTDEVYGSVTAGRSTEDSPLEPNSPYSASKTAADLLARAYFVTHKVPVIITRCCNNYGPYQYPEKLIPLFVTNLVDGKKVPVYGDGMQEREWIHVEDHCAAVLFLLDNGKDGEIYNIGTEENQTNMFITKSLIEACDKDESFIEHVEDRKGHDRRYALDSGKLKALGWEAKIPFAQGLKDTVQWYKENETWWRALKK